MAAYAIPRAEWSEAEEYRQRSFYWHYLVEKWLVPGPSVLKEQSPSVHDRGVGPSPRSLFRYGYLLEPESPCDN